MGSSSLASGSFSSLPETTAGIDCFVKLSITPLLTRGLCKVGSISSVGLVNHQGKIFDGCPPLCRRRRKVPACKSVLIINSILAACTIQTISPEGFASQHHSRISNRISGGWRGPRFCYRIAPDVSHKFQRRLRCRRKFIDADKFDRLERVEKVKQSCDRCLGRSFCRQTRRRLPIFVSLPVKDGDSEPEFEKRR